ncbi:Alpha/Beta hydrolase protein [Ochromonadaceae sp. CCMP2298]|nr:Alpha/Beta hydrolase protein [Ochromonadaceae sp. CCMP2298]
MAWLAESTRFFSFYTPNEIKLQGFYVPAEASRRLMFREGCEDLEGDQATSCKVRKSLGSARQQLQPVVLCAGWSESTVLYARFIRRLHLQGYDVFSYDLRGQGFSDSLVHESRGKVTHVDIFAQYVQDLEHFIKLVMPNQLHYATYNYFGDYDIKPVYVGISLSGLIGLTLLREQPSLISKLVLVTPCISPKLDYAIRIAIGTLVALGNGRNLAARVEHDDTKVLVTHSTSNALSWNKARDLVPEILKISGPSFGFLNELLRASGSIQQAAPELQNSMLIFQAERDEFVDNEAMGRFFSQLGTAMPPTGADVDAGAGSCTSRDKGRVRIEDEVVGVGSFGESNTSTGDLDVAQPPCRKLKTSKLVRLPGSYHGLLRESDAIFDEVMSELIDFLR